MKSLIKDIIIFLIGIIAEMYLNFQMPYLEATKGHGDGFVILMPVIFNPLVGLVVGVLIERKFKLVFPVIPAVFILLLMQFGYGQLVIGYVFICLFATLVGIGIGWGIRVLVLSIAESLKSCKKNTTDR